MLTKPKRTNFRTWDQIMQTEITTNPFNGYLLTLTEIGATAEDALQRMWENCEQLVSNYTIDFIYEIFISNYIANKKKYDSLVEFYNDDLHLFGDYYRNEEYVHTRTPDLTSETESSGSGSVDTTRNQTETRTETPTNYTTTNTHSVVPFDASTSPGARVESIDESVDSGSRDIQTSYSGEPDHTESESSASSTVTTTGTDKNEYTKLISGRDGRRPVSEVVEDGLKAAAMLDVLDVIINDLADQIFIQVWI